MTAYINRDELRRQFENIENIRTEHDRPFGVSDCIALLDTMPVPSCETCNDGDPVMGTDEEPRVYCGWHSIWWPSTAYCSSWTAREDG